MIARALLAAAALVLGLAVLVGCDPNGPDLVEVCVGPYCGHVP